MGKAKTDAGRLRNLRRSLRRIEAALISLRKQGTKELQRIEQQIAAVAALSVRAESEATRALADALPFDVFMGRLSLRARKCLERCGVDEPSKIATLSVLDLQSTVNCGRTTVLEITNLLDEYGIELPEGVQS